MNSFIEASLKQFFESRPDLFAEPSQYLGYEIDPKFSGDGGFRCSILFAAVKYQKGDTISSKSTMIKRIIPKSNCNPAEKIFHFVNEIFFYTHIIPFFNQHRVVSLFPEFYDSSLRLSTPLQDGIMIFENLQISGYKLAERESFLDYQHLRLMLRKLGNFHSHSYKAKLENPAGFRILCDLLPNVVNPQYQKYAYVITQMAKNGVENLRQDPRYSHRLSQVDQLLKNVSEFTQHLLTEEKDIFESVLCHGDYLRGNVLFKYDDGKPVDMKIIDLATCTLASPVVDLAQVLYLNADQRMRNEHWNDLIDEYYVGLNETFENNKLPTKDEILEQFKTKSFIGYLVAAYFLRISIPTDTKESSYEILKSEFEDTVFEEIPQEALCVTFEKMEGEKAAEALTNVLKDLLDRKFV